jgi:phospholipid/cholesterol/gamma-HCH transport system substrate-binding protein
MGGLIYIIMDKKGFFDEHLNFFFTTDNAASFFVGMPINFSGFEIGSITHLELTTDGKVKIIFRIQKRHHKWICEDTLLMLEKPLIGSPTIAAMTSLGYKELKNGSQLNIIIRDDINDIIINLQPLLNEVQHIISSINILTTNLASKDGPLARSLANIENFSSKLSNDEALLTTITGDKNSTYAVNQSLLKTDEIFQNIELLLKNIQTQIISPVGDTVTSVDAIFLDIQKKLNTLDATVNTLGSYDKELLLLKKELHLNLDKTHQLLEKVNTLLLDTSREEIELP